MHNIEKHQAERRRDEGMQRTALNSGPQWQSSALTFVRAYAEKKAFFLTEEVRQFAEARGLAVPPSKKAWGPVMKLAARRKLIKADGFALANSSNRSPKVLWQSLICPI